MSRPFRTLAASSNVAVQHWQLFLLGFTSIALSIASGWTTWDGMTNFTDNALLSFLITFGIQGVLLITAWLIGETFAKKEGGLPASAVRSRQTGPGLAIALVVCIIVIGAGIAWFSSPYAHQTSDWHFNYPIAIATFIAGILFLRNILYVSGNGEIAQPYDRCIRIILSNIPLWIMFLVCMVASVFFSFDSLFDKIFSSEDRARAGQSRVHIEVAGLLSDLSERLERHRRDAAKSLFASPQWRKYVEQIRALELEASNAPELFQAIRRTHTDLRDQRISKQLDVVSLERAKLGTLKERINFASQELREPDDALQRSKSLERDLEEKLSHQRDLMQRKGAEAKAEAIGIGITQKVGKGPQYRQIKKEQDELSIAAELLVEQISDAQARVARLVEKRLSKATQSAKLKSEAAKITSRIELAQARLASIRAQGDDTSDQSQSIAGQLNALSAAEQSFINAPGRESFAELQQQCTATLGILKNIKVGAPGPDHVDCSGSFANEATARVFAATAALARFQETCGKATKLKNRSTDELLNLGQSCLQISGLQSADILPLRSSLRKASLHRDDHAHRFIVTWNAFFDQNRLAFVALFIALAIDGLIFMSGLFGASARARISTMVAETTSTTPEDKEAILDAALLPHVEKRAHAVLEAVTYSNPREPGILGHVDVSKVDGDRAEVLRTLLNAASAIDLAHKTGPGQRYAVKPEFIDYLSRRLELQRGVNSNALVQSKPEELLRISLGAHKRRLAQLLLETSRPVETQSGLTHELDTKRCPADIRHLMTGVLNAGVASGFVLGDPYKEGRYLISAAFFSLIMRIADQVPTVTPKSDVPSATRVKVRKYSTDRNQADRSLRKRAPEKSGPIAPSIDNGDGAGLQKQSGESSSFDPEPVPTSSAASEKPTQTEANQSTEICASSPAREPSIVQTPTSPGDNDEPISQSQAWELRERACEASKPKSPETPARAATAAEEEPASKLIDFSNEAQIRRVGARKPEHQDSLPSVSKKPATQAEIFDALRRVTGLTSTELSKLCDPKERAMHNDARAALGALRAQDDLLEQNIAQLEKKFRCTLDEVSSALEDNLPHQSQSGANDPKASPRRFIDENFAPIFLQARGIPAVRSWCNDLISRFELAADVSANSATDMQTLSEIGVHIRSFVALDREHHSEWNELISRIEGLREGQEGSAAFGDIMP